MKFIQGALSFILSLALILSLIVLPSAVNFSVLSEVNTSEEPSFDSLSPFEAVSSGKKLDSEADRDFYTSFAPESTTALSEDNSGSSQAGVSAQESPSQAAENGNAAEDIPKALTSQAETVSMIAFDRDYSGFILSAEDKHSYTFSATSRGVLRYTLKHDNKDALGTWKVFLYQEYYINGFDGEKAYRVLNVLNTEIGSQSAESANIGLMPGEYRIVVSGGEIIPSEAYTLNVGFEARSDYEIECNDNIYRYTEIYGSVPMHGSSSYFDDRQDADHYLFRMPYDGFIRLSFAHENLGNIAVGWRVVLYDESGNEIYSENSPLGTVQIDSGAVGVKEGNYYIAVYTRVHCSADYTLTVSRNANGQYEAEPNDTMASADALRLNESIFGSVSSKQGSFDRDYYYFELVENGYISLRFLHEAVTGSGDITEGWNIILTSADGAVIYQLISAWEDSENNSPLIGLGQGGYYIRIDSENRYRNSISYELLVNFTQTSNWEKENNNSFETATPLVEDIQLWGTLVESGTDYDCDYFKFTLDSAELISVILEHESNGSERDIFYFTLFDGNRNEVSLVNEHGEALTDSDGLAVYGTQSLGNQERAAAFYKLEAGSYYVKISTGRFFDNMRYSIVFTNK